LMTPNPNLSKQQVIALEKSLSALATTAKKRSLPTFCTPATKPVFANPISDKVKVSKDQMSFTPQTESDGSASSKSQRSGSAAKTKRRKTVVPGAMSTPANQATTPPLTVNTGIVNRSLLSTTKEPENLQSNGEKPKSSLDMPDRKAEVLIANMLAGLKSITPPASVRTKPGNAQPGKGTASSLVPPATKAKVNHEASLQQKKKEVAVYKLHQEISIVPPSSVKVKVSKPLLEEKPAVSPPSTASQAIVTTSGGTNADNPAAKAIKRNPPSSQNKRQVVPALSGAMVEQTQKQKTASGVATAAQAAAPEKPAIFSTTREPSPIPGPSKADPSTPMGKPAKVQGATSSSVEAKEVSPDSKSGSNPTSPESFVAKGEAPKHVVRKEPSGKGAQSTAKTPTPALARKRSIETKENTVDAGSTKKRRLSNGSSSSQTTSEVPITKSVKPKKLSSALIKKCQFADLQAYLTECEEQQERLDLIERNHLPRVSVFERMGLHNGPPRHSDTDLIKDQEFERMKLAAQHRATHEQILKSVLRVAKDSVSELKDALTFAAVDEAEEHWRDSFRDYYEVLEETLFRQRNEASTLADKQSWEFRHFKQSLARIPVLETSFPFYGLFDQILTGIDSIVKVGRGANNVHGSHE
jgi:hypothetical protein